MYSKAVTPTSDLTMLPRVVCTHLHILHLMLLYPLPCAWLNVYISRMITCGSKKKGDRGWLHESFNKFPDNLYKPSGVDVSPLVFIFCNQLPEFLDVATKKEKKKKKKQIGEESLIVIIPRWANFFFPSCSDGLRKIWNEMFESEMKKSRRVRFTFVKFRDWFSLQLIKH